MRWKSLKNETAVTLFLAGNSTVVDQDDDPWASWGQMIPRFLIPGIAVSNQAESGLSLGSFLSGNRLKKVLNMMKPGDYLLLNSVTTIRKKKVRMTVHINPTRKGCGFLSTEFRKKVVFLLLFLLQTDAHSMMMERYQILLVIILKQPDRLQKNLMYLSLT